MKRIQTIEINKKLEDLNAKEKENSQKTLDVCTKLLKDEGLTEENFKDLTRRIAVKQGYDDDQVIVCSVIDLSEQLKLQKKSSFQTIFTICRKNEVTDCIFCIVSLSGKIICLFRDFFSIRIPENIQDIVKLSFGQNVDFKIFTKVEIMENERQVDILALKMLENMMTNVQPDLRKDYVESFANPKMNFSQKTTDLRKYFFSLLQNEYYKIVGNNLEVLSKDLNFKKEVKEFIKNVLLMKDGTDMFDKYKSLEREFEKKIEQGKNPDNIEMKELSLSIGKAKADALRNANELKSKFSKDEKSIELDIVAKFPEQMKMFTNLFEVLVHSEINEKADKRIREIFEKLDLDYEILKRFFDVKKKDNVDIESKENKECKKKDNNITPMASNIGDIIKEFPPFKIPKNKTDININSINQLLEDIKTDALSVDALREGHAKVKDAYKQWEAKTADDVRGWAVSKRGKLADTEIHEALGILDRANGLVTGGHRFRDPQILSMLVFLAQKDKGHLSQIQTGEGKTTIVSILAAIKVLQGTKVDVITSNPVLAEEGETERKLFYNLLNITVTTNNIKKLKNGEEEENGNYVSGKRECYKADIVYGSISNFQFDFLKDSFMGQGTRAGRPFETVFLDEVDSMIIDNANHVAKISGPLPGMDALKYIYIKIWQELHKAEAKIMQEFKTKLKLTTEEFKTLPEDEAQKKYDALIDEMKEKKTPQIKDYIKATNPTKIDIIPSHIQKYADVSLDRWIDNAINAKHTYQENEQYIIREKDGEAAVLPIDNQNTGVTMKNTIWQHGLHQFLQLKHNLQLTSESLTSCFISNLGYINKYGSRIYGLTGTLGSKPEQEMLSAVYSVGFSEIPPFKKKNFSEIESMVIHNELFSEIISEFTLGMVDSGRSCLIICETIKDASMIEEKLRDMRENISIRIFYNEDNAQATKEKLKPGEVIIATNIAGRGTNFKTTKDLEINGGLHVCVAFLPCNKRVEDQAFGRTSRQGNSGTANLLIKQSEVDELGIESDSFDYIKLVRDGKERDRIKLIEEVELLKINFQDKLFELFCDLYRSLNSKKQLTDGYNFVLEDLKECWAFWLEEKNYGKSNLANKKPEEEFEDFKMRAKAIIDGQINFNPYYAIQHAEYLISNDRFKEAKKLLNHAIDICKNPLILHGAYIKLFDVAIEEGNVFLDRLLKAVKDVFFITDIVDFVKFITSTPLGESVREYKEIGKKNLEIAKSGLQIEISCIDKVLENKKDSSYWFTTEDISFMTDSILKQSTNGKHFRSTLNKYQIETFCKEVQLKDFSPIFICYKDSDGLNKKGDAVHWIAICILKIGNQIKMLIKDPKGNSGNNMTIKEEFSKNWNNVDFICHTGIEQTNNASCGPMTLENIRIMIDYIEKKGFVKFVEDFQSLTFTQETKVDELRNEFVNTLPIDQQTFVDVLHSDSDNLFMKHMMSKRSALSFYIEHYDSLLEPLNQDIGVAISNRNLDFFTSTKEQSDDQKKIREIIKKSEIDELQIIGTGILYSLREIHDVPTEVIRSAQIQIASGLGLIATGIIFPLILPVASSIASNLIVDGIIDIVIELLRKSSDSSFDLKDHIYDKVVSHSINLLTMGISAMLKCAKVLKLISRAFKSFAGLLRKCPYFQKVFTWLARQLEKVAKRLEKLANRYKFAKLQETAKTKYGFDLNDHEKLRNIHQLEDKISISKSIMAELATNQYAKLSHFQRNMTILTQIAKQTPIKVVENTIENLLMTKVFTPFLTEALEIYAKSIIKNYVDAAAKETIDREKLKFCTKTDITTAICLSMKKSCPVTFFKKASLDILNLYQNWKWGIFTTVVKEVNSWSELVFAGLAICENFNDIVKPSAEKVNEDIDCLVQYTSNEMSDILFNEIIATAVQTSFQVYKQGYDIKTNLEKQRYKSRIESKKIEEKPEEDKKVEKNPTPDNIQTISTNENQENTTSPDSNASTNDMVEKNTTPDPNIQTISTNEKVVKIAPDSNVSSLTNDSEVAKNTKQNSITENSLNTENPETIASTESDVASNEPQENVTVLEIESTSDKQKEFY